MKAQLVIAAKLSGDSSQLAALAQVPLLAHLPLDPTLATLCNTGRIEEYRSQGYQTLAANLVTILQLKTQR